MTAFAITLGHVLGGSLVTEVVFNYPGLGNLLYLGIIARDYPLIQGQLLIMTLAILAANFIVDLIYVFLDPRLRRALKPMRGFIRSFLRNRKAAFGLAIVLFYVLVALAAPLITVHDPNKRVAAAAPTAVGRARHGLDPHGARRLHPARLGDAHLAHRRLPRRLHRHRDRHADRGHRRLLRRLGRRDSSNFLTNIVLVIPQLPLLLVLAAFIGQASPLVIAIIIGVTSWGWGARVTRAQTLSLRRARVHTGVARCSASRRGG